MFFVRKLVLACLRYNIAYKAKHIVGVSNILADALSRSQVQVPKHGQCSHTNPTLSAALELQPLILELLSSSLQKSSLPTYKRSWRLFQQFSHNIFGHASFSLAIAPTTLALFIAYLYDKGYAPSTVNTYVSALAYFHKLSNFPDPSKCIFRC